MSNTLTGLIPTIYNSLDVVSRELVGIIPSVTLDATYTRAAVGQTVMSPVAPAQGAVDIVPGVTPPNDGSQTIGNVPMTITKAKRVPILWGGEESRGLANNGASRELLLRDQFSQAFRTLCNLVEADGAALYASASRATGTPGQTPFGTAGDFTDATNVAKILKDNGAPMSEASLILDTTAGAKLAGLQSRYDIAGADALMIQQQGVLTRKANMMLRESAAIKEAVAVGTGSAYTTTAAGFAVGTTQIPLITGTGTVLAGDIVKFAGDSHQYVVAAGVSAPGTITLAAPGLQQAIPASATALTIVGAASRNMAFARSAIALATRAPALPEEGDMAADRQMVTDPRSGLSFEVAMYKLYRQVQYEVSLAWGWAAIKPEHMALLLG